MKKFVKSILLLPLLMAGVSCYDTDNNDTTPTNPTPSNTTPTNPTPSTPTVVKVTGVTLDTTSKTIEIGSTFTLTPTVAPNNATNKGVTWASSDNSIATVSNAGLVTAVAQGSATITVTTVDGKFTSSCTVKVVRSVTGLSLNKSEETLIMGDTLNLEATVTPSDATDSSLSWTSSDTSVATVSDQGVVNTVDEGSATITATTTDGGYSATCTVDVFYELEDFSIRENLYLINGTTADLSNDEFTKFTPYNFPYNTVTWTSLDESVATISSTGEVTAVGVGTTTFQATSTRDESLVKDCSVTVLAADTDVIDTIDELTTALGSATGTSSDPTVFYVSGELTTADGLVVATSVNATIIGINTDAKISDGRANKNADFLALANPASNQNIAQNISFFNITFNGTSIYEEDVATSGTVNSGSSPGGGIYIRNNYQNCSFDNCILESFSRSGDETLQNNGAALQIYGGTVSLKNSVVRNNACVGNNNSEKLGVVSLGGITAATQNNSNLTISNCDFYNNYSTGHGPCLSTQATSTVPNNINVTVDKTVFRDNVSLLNGSAISLFDKVISKQGSYGNCSASLHDVVIANNNVNGDYSSAIDYLREFTTFGGNFVVRKNHSSKDAENTLKYGNLEMRLDDTNYAPLHIDSTLGSRTRISLCYSLPEESSLASSYNLFVFDDEYGEIDESVLEYFTFNLDYYDLLSNYEVALDTDTRTIVLKSAA